MGREWFSSPRLLWSKRCSEQNKTGAELRCNATSMDTDAVVLFFRKVFPLLSVTAVAHSCPITSHNFVVKKALHNFSSKKRLCKFLFLVLGPGIHREAPRKTRTDVEKYYIFPYSVTMLNTRPFSFSFSFLLRMLNTRL